MANVYAPIVVLSLAALAVLVGYVVRELRRSNEILAEILRTTSIKSRDIFPEKGPVSTKKMAS